MVYNLVRLEEKAIIEAAKKRSGEIDFKFFDSKDLYLISSTGQMFRRLLVRLSYKGVRLIFGTCT